MNKLFLTILTLSYLWSLPGRAAEAVQFNPDSDPSRIQWTALLQSFGPKPNVRGQRFGVVLKTQTNEYWRLMASGYRQRAAADGVKLDIQAAQSENDPAQQLAIAENMIGGRYKGLLISPQSTLNLQTAIEDAHAVGLPLVEVDGAVVDSVTHFVGPINRKMGVQVAKWFVEHYPNGGQVAVIEGQAGVFSTIHRSAGFRDTIVANKKFKVIASVPGNWDTQQSYDAALKIVRDNPEIIGFYCDNDTMALGVVEAVKALNRLDQIRIFGTDGTQAAYRSIAAGELTGTVDIFPKLIGEIGLDVAERLSMGQTIPRVVATPQAIVTRAEMARYDASDEEALLKMLKEDADDQRGD